MKLLLKIVLVLLLFISSGLQAQEVKMLGEGQGDQVRLRWNVTSWKYNYIGFNVKRRVFNEKKPNAWTTLNPSVIHPEISVDRDLKSASNSDSVQLALKNLFNEKEAAGTWSKFDSLQFIEELQQNGTEPLKLLLGLDYDITLIAGFGYIDDNLPKPKGGSYEYQVSVLLNDGSEIDSEGTFVWKWGTTPVIDVKIEPALTSNKKKTKIRARWSVDTKSFRAANSLLGFNIYHITPNGKVPVNEGILFPDVSSETSYVTATDKRKFPAAVSIRYEIRAVTAMNREFVMGESSYNPDDVPSDFEVLMDTVYDLNFDLNQDAFVSWSVPKDQERFIKNYIVYRGKGGPSSMKVITDTLSASSRTWVDRSFKKNHDKFNYKIEAVLKGDFLSVHSLPFEYDFYRKYIPPKAREVVGAYVLENGKRVLRFNFSVPDHEELLGYKLLELVEEDGASRWVAHNVPATKGPIVEEVNNYIGEKKVFAVQGYTTDFVAGPLSDSIEVIIGGEFMQRVYLKWSYDKESHSVKLKWEYDQLKYPELVGYRVYMDGELLADENRVVASLRSYQTGELDYGWHQFEMIAVSKYGTLSEPVPTQKLFIRKYY